MPSSAVPGLSCLTLLFLLAGCSEPPAVSTPEQPPPKKPLRSLGGSTAPPLQRGPFGNVVTAPSMSIDFGRLLPLLPGERAPEFQVAEWVHGEPVDQLEEGRVYVVEFWATWCAPCLQSMPHLAELQQKYADDVTFVGVTTETADVVGEFLSTSDPATDRTWKDTITYRLAVDDDGKTTKGWQEAAEQEGIPFAVIVGRDGQIQWMGHPTEIDRPLEEVVQGSWDLRPLRQRMISDATGQDLIDENQRAIVAAIEASNFREAVSITDRMLKKSPGNHKILSLKRQLLVDGQLFVRVNETLKAEVQAAKGDADALNHLAWEIATQLDFPDRDLQIALDAALQASELKGGRDVGILDTVARVYFELDQPDKAFEWQKKAVELAPEDADLKESLALYRREAGVEDDAADVGVEDPSNSEPTKK